MSDIESQTSLQDERISEVEKAIEADTTIEATEPANPLP